MEPYFDGYIRHLTVPITVPVIKVSSDRRDGYRYRKYGHRTTVNTATVYSPS